MFFPSGDLIKGSNKFFSVLSDDESIILRREIIDKSAKCPVLKLPYAVV